MCQRASANNLTICYRKKQIEFFKTCDKLWCIRIYSHSGWPTRVSITIPRLMIILMPRCLTQMTTTTSQTMVGNFTTFLASREEFVHVCNKYIRQLNCRCIQRGRLSTSGSIASTADKANATSIPGSLSFPSLEEKQRTWDQGWSEHYRVINLTWNNVNAIERTAML